MKKIVLLCLFAGTMATSFAQKETFDLTTYTPPKNWKKEVKPNSYTSYSITNKQKKTYCQIFIMLSTTSKGGIKEDFDNEWKELIKKPNNKEPQDPGNVVKEIGSWKIKTGRGKFTFNKSQSIAVLTTMSGYNRCVSIVATTNSLDYIPAIEQLLASVEMKNLSTDNPVNQPAVQPVLQPTIQPASNSKFAFTTTNFDDGWVGTEQPDWVRVTKSNTVVLLHYAQPNIRDFNNLDEATAFVWNTIVVPRYSNISNLWIRKKWYADGDFMNAKYYAGADLTENATGKKVHVVLYKSGNAGKWIEFITPDKVSFQNLFTVVYQQDGTNWDKLSVMANYNKFAVTAGDLPGNWKSSSGASIEYYNVYTGNNMGMASASSTTEFIFQPGGTYTSVYKGVDGFNGNNRYVGETNKGKCIVSNWEMKLTNRFKGATETFTIQFEAVKGGRILHMYRGSVEELHLFKMK